MRKHAIRESAFQLILNGDSMKVFVVDDSVVIRQRLKRMLADEVEIEVIGEAGDAQAATTAILEQKPDVVLLDIHLLNGSGIDVLQNLKKIKPGPAVIILTDYPYPEYRQLCLDAGADFFFVKSSEFEQVVPALKQLSALGGKMEILEIQSSQSLLTSRPDSRPAGAHVYQVNCRQFNSTYRSWQKNRAAHEHPLAVMTLGFERLWITREEAEQMAAAIQSARSPVVLAEIVRTIG